MRLLLIVGTLLSCHLLFSQKKLIILPVEVIISPGVSTGLFTKKAKAAARSEVLSKKAKQLTLEFQEYTDEIVNQFELAYPRDVNFLRSEEAIPDSLRYRYLKLTGAIDQAIFRNQRKKDDGLSVSIYPKGYANKDLREENEKNLRETGKPLEAHLNGSLFLKVKVLGMQNSPLKGKGIYGGIRIQVILTDTGSGETILFKTHSKGTMKTVKRGNGNNYVPPSAASVRKSSYQGKLTSMLKAGMDKGAKLLQQ